jgi:signal transduction histidine kinase
MQRAHPRFHAALALSALSLPCHASGVEAGSALPLGLALGWLLLIGLGFRRLLRHQLGRSDRLSEAESLLAIERHGRLVAERALADTHCALCRLVEQQDTVRQTERQRIARDIHDDLGQNLLALKIELAMLQVGASLVQRRKLDCMIGNLDLAIRSLRSIINDLRPLALEAGLQAAVEWQLAEFSRIHGIVHVLHAERPMPADKAERQCDAVLYRILQEALANVARHAQATEVEVTLKREQGSLLLAVRDNGIGMPAAAPGDCRHGCGLHGIAQRIAAIGGQFAIDSADGGGTTLTLSVPLSRAIDAD